MMTMIARTVDGLPLVGTMQENEEVSKTKKMLNFRFFKVNIFLQSGKNILEYQNQAKMLFRKITPSSPQRCTLETGPYLFQ